MADGANKRVHPRVKSANLVSFAEFRESDVPEILGMGATEDLSEGGIKLRCWQALPIPSEVSLDFALGEDILTVKGRAVYAEEVEPGNYLIGIRFQDIAEDDLKRLQEYMDQKQ